MPKVVGPVDSSKCTEEPKVSSSSKPVNNATSVVRRKPAAQTKTSVLRQQLAACDTSSVRAKTDAKLPRHASIPVQQVKTAGSSSDLPHKRKKLKDDKSTARKTKHPISKAASQDHTTTTATPTTTNSSTTNQPSSNPSKKSIVSKTTAAATQKASNCIDRLASKLSNKTSKSSKISGVSATKKQGGATINKKNGKKNSSSDHSTPVESKSLPEAAALASFTASTVVSPITPPQKRVIRGRLQKPNVKSDSELYGDDRLKAVLEVLRSNLSAEEKLRAIKASHDRWERHSQESVMTTYLRAAGELSDMLEPRVLVAQSRADALKSSLQCTQGNSTTEPGTVQVHIQEPDEHPVSSGNVKDVSDPSANNVQADNKTDIESSSCLSSAVPTVACCATSVTPTISSECFLDSEFPNSRPPCDVWTDSNENRKFLKLDTKLFPSDSGVSPPKSPLTVQEWVDSLERTSCIETSLQGEDDDFRNSSCVSESKDEEDYVDKTQLETSFPASDPSAEDNLKLGAEAYNLEDLHQEEPTGKSGSLNHLDIKSAPQQRVNLSQLRAKQSSFNSETSGFSTVSSISSIDSLLDARREDPEEILFALGFGGKPADSPLKRIPPRFLSQPSVAAGIDVNTFLQSQEEFQQSSDFSCLSYLGLSGCSQIQAIPSTVVTQKVIENLKDKELKRRKSSTFSCVSLPEFATVVRVATAFRAGKMRNSSESILDPANREFLEQQGKDVFDRPKKLIIGKLAYSFDQEGSIVQNSPEAVTHQQGSSSNNSTKEGCRRKVSVAEEDQSECFVNLTRNGGNDYADGDSCTTTPTSTSSQKDSEFRFTMTPWKKAALTRQARISAGGLEEIVETNPKTECLNSDTCGNTLCVVDQCKEASSTQCSAHIPSNQSESSGFADECSLEMPAEYSTNRTLPNVEKKPLLRANSDTLVDKMRKNIHESSCLTTKQMSRICFSKLEHKTKNMQDANTSTNEMHRYPCASSSMCYLTHSCTVHAHCPHMLIDESNHLEQEVRNLCSSGKFHPAAFVHSCCSHILSSPSNKSPNSTRAISCEDGSERHQVACVSKCFSLDQHAWKDNMPRTDAACQADFIQFCDNGTQVDGATRTTVVPLLLDGDSQTNAATIRLSGLETFSNTAALLPNFHILQLLSTQTLIELHNLRLALEYHKIQGRQTATASLALQTYESPSTGVPYLSAQERSSLQSLSQLRKDICTEVLRMEELIAQRLSALQSNTHEVTEEDNESARYFTAVSKRIVELLREQSVICQKLHEIVRNEVMENETASSSH